MEARPRRRRRRQPPSSSASASASSPDPSTPREDAVVQSSTKKTCSGSTSFLSFVSGPQGWADLPDGILHSIIALFPSFRDLLAFAATCRPWSDAFSSYHSTFNFCTFFPPLLLRPCIPLISPIPPTMRRRRQILSKCTWRLLDPANTLIPFHCLVPLQTLNRMHFVGCSHGHLIFSHGKRCLLVDALTGTEVIPPHLPFTDNHTLCYGTLTAPLSSPESSLLVSTRFSLFKWQVGSEFWCEHPLDGVDITQIVVFNGQIFAMDFYQRLLTIHLAPSLSVQELAVGWAEDMAKGLSLKPWLVVCRDMLLLVGSSINMPPVSATIRAFRLDLSSKPAAWVKVENLGDCSLFLGPDWRSPTFSCTNPERWGGNSNCIYYASACDSWSVIRLGETVSDISHPDSPLWNMYETGRFSWPQPIWVFPSMFY